MGRAGRTAASRFGVPQRKDQCADGRCDRDDGARRQAARRRHRARGDRIDHAELGHLQRHRVHGRRDRHAGRRTSRATRRSASPDVAGQRMDGLQAAAAAGRSAAALRGQTGTWLTDTNHAGLADPRATSCGTRRPPTCRSSTRCGSTSTTCSTRPYYHRRLQQHPEPRAARAPLAGIGDARYQLRLERRPVLLRIPERPHRRPGRAVSRAHRRGALGRRQRHVGPPVGAGEVQRAAARGLGRSARDRRGDPRRARAKARCSSPPRCRGRSSRRCSTATSAG